MKPLKILLGNNTLSLLAGSETWTYILAMQLKIMGHQVSCFGGELGIISDKLIEAGIPCYNAIETSGVKPYSVVLEEKIDHDYDIIIANHNNIVSYLRKQFPKTPIISTVHGIIHFQGKEMAPEHPALDSGVNQFVSVSEEIQNKLKQDYNVDSIIIRNFFDIKKLGSLKPVNPGKPRQFFINTNYHGRDDKEIQVVRDAAKIMGAKLAAVGYNFTQQFDIDKAIEDSDVVFARGRSVLEGVAAGRLGIVHGLWGTGGPIIESNLSAVRYCNFSGRNAEKMATPEELVALIEKYYHPQFLDWGKEYMAREHNVVFAAERYVQLARELTGQTISKASVNQAVDPAAKPFKLAKS